MEINQGQKEVMETRGADSAIKDSERAIGSTALITRWRITWWKTGVAGVFIFGAATAFIFLNSTKTGVHYVPQPKASAALAEYSDLIAGTPFLLSGDFIAGSPVIFGVPVENKGIADAPAFKTIFEIDYDSTAFLSPDKGYYGNEAPMLGKGAIMQIDSSAIVLPANNTKGTHAVRACIDIFGEVAESNESNNCGPILTFSIQNVSNLIP